MATGIKKRRNGTSNCRVMEKKMISKRLAVVGLLAGATTLTGCASIVNGNNQVVSVEARHKGQHVFGASCTLVNPKGTFFVTTPGTVTVRRAYDDMNVKCDKDGMGSGIAAVKSSTKPMAFGNIIFGGVVGAAIDVGSGAAYDYPTLISVIMEESVVLSLPPTSNVQPDAASSGPVAQK
jgi:hypothetical protein